MIKGGISKSDRARQIADRQHAHRVQVNEIKLASGCVDCPSGTVWPPECLDFDHVRGEKLFNISSKVGISQVRMLAEIEKCEVVCANHHRIRTWRNRG